MCFFLKCTYPLCSFLKCTYLITAPPQINPDGRVYTSATSARATRAWGNSLLPHRPWPPLRHQPSRSWMRQAPHSASLTPWARRTLQQTPRAASQRLEPLLLQSLLLQPKPLATLSARRHVSRRGLQRPCRASLLLSLLLLQSTRLQSTRLQPLLKALLHLLQQLLQQRLQQRLLQAHPSWCGAFAPPTCQKTRTIFSAPNPSRRCPSPRPSGGARAKDKPPPTTPPPAE